MTRSQLCARAALFVLLVLLAGAAHRAGADDSPWKRIDAAVQEGIAAGQAPGVVVLVGHEGKIVYRKAFGLRSVRPEQEPMTADTVFDLASLTKVVATTSSIMALVEEGKLRLGDRVSTHWPEFAQNGKERVTIRQLLTHTSGLAAWQNFFPQFSQAGGEPVQEHTEKVLAAIAALKLTYPTDTRFVYSDLGYITLGEVVRRVGGMPLDEYARRRIFAPLGMKQTTFNPRGELLERAAPTEMRYGQFLRGAVHDPNAAVMGGVAGHAGLFGTANDLARFAEMLLCSDALSEKKYPLSPYTVREMTTPHSPPRVAVRGLGWDIDSPYSHVRGDLLPVGSFGHTGFTGTYMWVDPGSRTYIIALSNRVHPDGKGSPLGLWARIANIVAGIVRPGSLPVREAVEASRAPVLTGVDVLERDGFKALQGRKVGLITNRTGVNRRRVSTIDLLSKAPGVQLVALFAPEHGLRAELDASVASSRDEKTGLPIISLYEGSKRKPTSEDLKGIDTLVFDIQDVGVRYYTYSSTMGMAMEVAAENGIRFVVLDRPNPINGIVVDGPVLEPELKSFVAYYRIPVRHGMTLGELAKYYNEQAGIKCDLTVIPMENWRRKSWFEASGLPWVDPSPNIRNTRQAELYAAIGLIEHVNLSVGRGTDTPFERFGAPWIDGTRLAEELNRRRLPGLTFIPVSFRPNGSVYRDEQCGGVDIRMLDRSVFESTRTALEIMDALVRLYPQQVKLDRTPTLWGTRRVRDAVLAGRPIPEITRGYEAEVRAFERERTPYLLYR